MTRDRSAGRCSSRNPSPCQNSSGGVDRSTSSTNPGRGISPPPPPRPPRPPRFPWQNDTELCRFARESRWGGGDSSVSFLLVAEVEGDLHGAARAGVGGV